jgi:predicted transcriptional regulator
MKKRERLELIKDILTIIKQKNNSIKRTPLLRYSNLSSQRFNEYYAELTEKHFIKEIQDKKGKTFITLTDKGFKFLEKYNIIINFIDDFGL